MRRANLSTIISTETSAGETTLTWKRTHAAVDVLPSLSVVSSRAGVDTSSMVGQLFPVQDQEESFRTTHTAIVTGTLQTTPTVLCCLPLSCTRQDRVHQEVELNKEAIKIKEEEAKMQS